MWSHTWIHWCVVWITMALTPLLQQSAGQPVLQHSFSRSLYPLPVLKSIWAEKFSVSPGIFIHKPAICGISGINNKPKELPSRWVRTAGVLSGWFHLTLHGTGTIVQHLSLGLTLNLSTALHYKSCACNISSSVSAWLRHSLEPCGAWGFTLFFFFLILSKE